MLCVIKDKTGNINRALQGTVKNSCSRCTYNTYVHSIELHPEGRSSEWWQTSG